GSVVEVDDVDGGVVTGVVVTTVQAMASLTDEMFALSCVASTAGICPAATNTPTLVTALSSCLQAFPFGMPRIDFVSVVERYAMAFAFRDVVVRAVLRSSSSVPSVLNVPGSTWRDISRGSEALSQSVAYGKELVSVAAGRAKVPWIFPPAMTVWLT